MQSTDKYLYCQWPSAILFQPLLLLLLLGDGVFNLQFSDGLTLSWYELNAIALYLATDRQT